MAHFPPSAPAAKVGSRTLTPVLYKAQGVARAPGSACQQCHPAVPGQPSADLSDSHRTQWSGASARSVGFGTAAAAGRAIQLPFDADSVRHRPPTSVIVRHRPPSFAIIHHQNACHRPPSSIIVRHRPTTSAIVHYRPPSSAIVRHRLGPLPVQLASAQAA